MIRGLVVVSAALLAVVGCGGSGSDLERTAAALDDIRSGDLTLKAGLDPDRGDSFSYELSGPFQFPEDDSRAEVDFRYRQTHGTVTEEARLFAADGDAWIEVDGERHELTEQQLQGLVVGERDEGFLDGLDIESWYVDEQTEEAADGTVVISGDAHAGRTLVGLMTLAGGLGDGTLELDEESEDRIDRLARASRLEIVTGAEDHLLRRLSYEVELALDVAGELGRALADLDGARLTFDLEIRSPNEPVQIQA